MKILSINKGFVTNSSSANYWLDDGVLEAGEAAAIIDKANSGVAGNGKVLTPTEKKKINEEIKKSLEEPIIDFTIWFLFSIIMLLVLLSKKLHKKC